MAVICTLARTVSLRNAAGFVPGAALPAVSSTAGAGPGPALAHFKCNRTVHADQHMVSWMHLRKVADLRTDHDRLQLALVIAQEDCAASLVDQLDDRMPLDKVAYHDGLSAQARAVQHADARRMQLPRRLAVILEGEGLANDANDATALILYRFAIAAVSTGSFSFGRAAGMFAAILAGEFLWGIGVGWVMLRLRRWVGDTRIEITLSILTPFLASGRPNIWAAPACSPR